MPLAFANAHPTTFTLPATGIFTGCTFVAGGSTTPMPLDDLALTAFAAFSLRKVRAAYGGSAVNVRRSTDDTTQDIGFTDQGDFDGASFTSFMGASGHAVGFVTKWYDQSGAGLDAVQAVASAQPFISPAGPSALRWTVAFGSGASLESTGSASLLAAPWSISSVSQRTSGVTTISPIETLGGPGGIFYEGTGIIGSKDNTTDTNCVGPTTEGAWHNVIGTTSGATSSITIDGTTTVGTSASGLTNLIQTSVGAATTFNQSEAMVLPGLSSVQTTSLYNNMQGYWQRTGAVYVMSSDGKIYTPNFITNSVSYVGTFGTTPTWGLTSSGSTLFTVGAGTALEKFTLSSTFAGTSGTIAGTPSNLTALDAIDGAVGVGGYSFSTLVSGFTATCYNTFSPVMLGVNAANNTIQLWGDTYGETWTFQTTVSGTAPTSCAWAGQSTALVSVSGAVQVITRNNSLINRLNSITVANAGALAVSPDLQTALVCQGASNSVTVLGKSSTIWGVQGSPLTGITNPTAVATTTINTLPSAFLTFANGVAQAQFSNATWSISNRVTLSYTPSAIFVDALLNCVYVCGTSSGSGHINVFDFSLAAISNVSFSGSADSLTEANAQIAVADAANSSIHISDGFTIKNTYSSLAGVNYIAASAITLMATNGTTTNLYQFTAPFEIKPIRFGKVGYLSGASWNTATLPNEHVPTAVGFDDSARCWATTQLNGVYQVNSSGAVVASGYQITPPLQAETTPLGISTLQFWNNKMYSGQSLFGSLIEGVTPSLFNPPVSPLPLGLFAVVNVPPAAPPPPPGTPPPPPPPPPPITPPGSPPPPPPPVPNYQTGVYFGPGSAGEGLIRTFETTAGRVANSLYTMAFGGFSSSSAFTGGAASISSLANTARRVVFGFPLCWTGATPAQIAAGTFDSTVTSLVSGLVPFTNQISSISLGWHPNASEGLPWQGILATDYVAAFRHVVPLIRAQFATTPITWDVMAGVSGGGGGGGTTVVVLTNTALSSWMPPAGITKLDLVECWGAGGQGANFWALPTAGGGGAYAAITNLTISNGVAIPIHIGIGGQNTSASVFSGDGDPGTPTWFNSVSTCFADPGLGGIGGGNGGTAGIGLGGKASNSVGTTVFSGGNGGDAVVTSGGGGGAAGPNGAGVVGETTTSTTQSGNGGAGDAGSGGAGGAGDTASAAARNGTANVLGGGGGGGANYFAGGSAGSGGLPGGGGGGDNSNAAGTGFGANGQIRITYSIPVSTPTAYYPGDDVVQIIGSDIYESVVGTYANALTATAGLNFLAAMTSVTSGVNTTVSGSHKILSVPLWSATAADSTFVDNMAGWINTNMQGSKIGGYQMYDNTTGFQSGTQSLVNFGSIVGNSFCLIEWESFWGNAGGAPPPAPPPPPPPLSPPPAPPPPPGGRQTLLGFYLDGPTVAIRTWLNYHPDYTINSSFQVHTAGGEYFPPVGTGTPYPIMFDLDISSAGMTYADVAAGIHDTDFNTTLASIAINSSYSGAWIYAFTIDSKFNNITDWQTSISTYITAFNHVAGLVRAVFPNAKIIFNPNTDPGLALSGDATLAWPSGADLFGGDVNFDPAVFGTTSTLAWSRLFGSSGTAPTGTEAKGTMAYYMTFAKSKGVPYCVPTWIDLYQPNGDFTAFSNMISCCRLVVNNIVAVTYWDSPDAVSPATSALSTGAQLLMANGFAGNYAGTFWTFIQEPADFPGF